MQVYCLSLGRPVFVRLLGQASFCFSFVYFFFCLIYFYHFSQKNRPNLMKSKNIVIILHFMTQFFPRVNQSQNSYLFTNSLPPPHIQMILVENFILMKSFMQVNSLCHRLVQQKYKNFEIFEVVEIIHKCRFLSHKSQISIYKLHI